MTKQTYEVVSPDQNSHEWLFERLGTITATDVAVMFQKPRIKSEEFSKTQIDFINQKAVERVLKTRGIEALTDYFNAESAKFENNEDIQRGKDHEKYAVMAYENFTKNIIDVVGFCRSVERPYFGCSPDGLIIESGAVIEVKCPRVYNHYYTVKNKFVRDIYKYQMMAQQLVLNAPYVHFISFCAEALDGHELFLMEFQFTDDDLNSVVEKVEYYNTLIELEFQKLKNLTPQDLGKVEVLRGDK